MVAAIFVACFPREGDGLTRTVFLAWLLIPIGLAGLMSLARPVFQSNYLIFCLAPLVLITSVAVFRVSHRIGQSALVLGLIGLCAIQLSRYYAHPSVQDWRRASLHVFQFERPGDAIVFYPEFAHKPFDYYARRFAPAYVPRNDSGPANRTWLMIRGSDARMHPDDVSRIQADLGKSATAIERSRFHLVDVELYVR